VVLAGTLVSFPQIEPDGPHLGDHPRVIGACPNLLREEGRCELAERKFERADPDDQDDY
jgi:hypothetical protein